MNSLDRPLIDIVQAVWKCTLALDVVPCAPAGAESGPRCRSTVTIEGAWNGALTISCPAVLARDAAEVFFGRPADAVTEAEALDALGELANMTGGNLKALLPAPCRLSTPRSESGADPAPVPGSLRKEFACSGRRFSVELIREDRP